MKALHGQRGASLMELITFILMTNISVVALMLVFTTIMNKVPATPTLSIANLLANQCMESYIGQRRLLGYSNSLLTCSNSPSLPANCTTLPGFNVAATIACNVTLPNDGSSISKTISVTVSGLAKTTMTALLASY